MMSKTCCKVKVKIANNFTIKNSKSIDIEFLNRNNIENIFDIDNLVFYIMTLIKKVFFCASTVDSYTR